MNFKFGDKWASELGLVVKSKNRPVLPSMRQRYETVIGRDGTLDFSDGSLEDRIIEIECCFYKGNVADLRYNIRNIAKWLHGGKKKQRLIFDDEPDLYYFGRLQNQVDLEQMATFGEFTLQFRCDPLAYAIELAEFVNDFESPTIMYRDIRPDDVYRFEDVTDGQYLEVNNYGTYEVKPIINIAGISGVSGNRKLSIIMNSETLDITLDGSGSTFSSLNIDMDKYMVLKMGTENYLKNVSGNFSKLVSGINQVLITGDFTSIASISFEFRARFL